MFGNALKLEGKRCLIVYYDHKWWLDKMVYEFAVRAWRQSSTGLRLPNQAPNNKRTVKNDNNETK